jgi:hypothetical protein
MILSVRTAGIQSGKQAAAHINSTLPGLNVRATRSVGGLVACVHWISEYASLADFESKWAKLEADASYQALLKEARDANLFDASSIRDDLHQTIG